MVIHIPFRFLTPCPGHSFNEHHSVFSLVNTDNHFIDTCNSLPPVLYLHLDRYYVSFGDGMPSGPTLSLLLLMSLQQLS